MKLFIMLLLLFTSVEMHALSYGDCDLDGVVDSIDQCPNTPFDVLVDAFGCPQDSHYNGTLNLLVGTLISVDSDVNSSTSAQFFLSYAYKKWEVSLSTYKIFQNTLEDNDEALYVSVGYTLATQENMDIKISAGSKVSQRQNDYYGMIDIGYTINQQLSLLGSYAYSVAEDNNVSVFNNYHSLSVGLGYNVNDAWHISCDIDYSGASAEDEDDYLALNVSSTYMFNKNIYMLSQYSYGLSDGTSEHALSLLLGLSIE